MAILIDQTGQGDEGIVANRLELCEVQVRAKRRLRKLTCPLSRLFNSGTIESMLAEVMTPRSMPRKIASFTASLIPKSSAFTMIPILILDEKHDEA